jgi:hypothetical protein
MMRNYSQYYELQQFLVEKQPHYIAVEPHYFKLIKMVKKESLFILSWHKIDLRYNQHIK